LHKQGLVRITRRVCPESRLAAVPYRAVRVERAPRGLGWCWAFTFDELGSPNTARSLRRHRAKRLREARAVARAMAADRLALQAEERFAITPAGVAEAARATA
jgi:hypothetical protein